MQQFTIRDIENLTGIKAHTLRIWEQRYGFFSPKRKESRHRFYDNEDLKRLLQIAFLYHSGWKVSKIASLSPEQLAGLVSNTQVGSDNYRVFINKLIEAAVEFNEAAFTRILDEVIAAIGFDRCIVEVAYPFLIRVGHLWSTNNAIPAQEHFSSYLIQNRILVETEKVSRQLSEVPDVLLLCPQGEFHELPLLFINYLLRNQGKSTLFLGVDVKANDVAMIMETNPIPVIYFYLTVNFTGLLIDEYLSHFCTSFPSKKIVVSGPGTAHIQRSFVNLLVLRTDEEIYRFIHSPISEVHSS
jgi:DNA-binding transcriptional MerR regulator